MRRRVSPGSIGRPAFPASDLIGQPERASIVTVVAPTPVIIYYLHFPVSSMYSRTTCILQADGEGGRMSTNRVAWRNLAPLAVLCAAWRMQAQDAKQPYPRMAPIEQYRMDRDAEVALARTAAPASISK